MLSKKCVVCGKEFFKSQTRSLESWNKVAKYCSHSCGSKAKAGKPSWNFKGNKLNYPVWNKGKKCPQTTGDKNGAWKGTDDKYWRQKALDRDDHTCQNCGYRDLEIMEVDHIKEKSDYPELRFNLDNLQTLCPNCHAKKTKQQLKLKRKQLITNEIYESK